MIKQIEISGSDYSVMQQVLTSNPQYSASISTTSSLSNSVIICNVTFETRDWKPINALKYMEKSASYFLDLPLAEADNSGSV